MMTTPFGAPTYDEPTGQDTAPAGPNGHAAVEEVALDDPRLLSSENVESNETGDAFAAPPVLPDGKHRAKLSLAKIKDAKGQEQDFRTYLVEYRQPAMPTFCINVQSEVIDHTGKFDGYKLTHYWAKTLLADRGLGQGTSEVATIIRMSGGKVPTGATQAQVKDIALKHLASEPETIIETCWEASCESCQKRAKAAGEKTPKPFLTGMHRFPQPRTGQYDPIAICPVCKTQARAQVRILRYYPVAAAPTAMKTA